MAFVYEHEDRIEKRGKKFVVLSSEGKVLGRHSTRAAALEQLGAVETSKARESDEEEDARRKRKPATLSSHAKLWASADDREACMARIADGTIFGATLAVRRIDFLGDLHTDEAHQDEGVFLTRTVEGFLRADARINRIGIQTYKDRDGNKWNELRTEDEVFHPDTISSFALKVVTNDHPEEFVNVDNVGEVFRGISGSNPHRDENFTRTEILITDADTIRDVEDGKLELSCGYTAQVVVERGVTDDGTPFAGRQTNIRGNHIALVSKGRAGRECRLLARGDAFSTLYEDTMKTKKVKIGDQEFSVATEVADALENKNKEDATVKIGEKTFPVPDAVATEFNKMSKSVQAAEAAKAKAAEAEATKAEGGSKDSDSDTKDDPAVLRARLDAMEAENKARKNNEAARIDVRVKLVTAAQTVLGESTKTDDVSDADLMIQVINDVLPDLKGKTEKNRKDAGYIRALFDEAMRAHKRASDAEIESNHVLFDVFDSENKDKYDVDKIYEDYLRKVTNAHKTQPQKEA